MSVFTVIFCSVFLFLIVATITRTGVEGYKDSEHDTIPAKIVDGIYSGILAYTVLGLSIAGVVITTFVLLQLFSTILGGF